MGGGASMRIYSCSGTLEAEPAWLGGCAARRSTPTIRPISVLGVSLTLRLICGYLLRSLLPFLTCIYQTLLDLEILKMRVGSGIGFFKLGSS